MIFNVNLLKGFNKRKVIALSQTLPDFLAFLEIFYFCLKDSNQSMLDFIGKDIIFLKELNPS